VALRGDYLVEATAAVIVFTVDDALGLAESHVGVRFGRGRHVLKERLGGGVGSELARNLVVHGVEILVILVGGDGSEVGVFIASAVEISVEGDRVERRQLLLHSLPFFLRLRDLGVYRRHAYAWNS